MGAEANASARIGSKELFLHERERVSRYYAMRWSIQNQAFTSMYHFSVPHVYSETAAVPIDFCTRRTQAVMNNKQ
jgi:hypothetical protein